jgi:hypothetical protein
MEKKEKEESAGLSRRDFLKAAAAGAAGVAVTGALAACENPTTEYRDKLIGNYDRHSLGYPWDEKPPEDPKAGEILREETCDVLVAGTGIAGSCAILAAAEAGKKVFYCDKTAEVNSNSGDITVFGIGGNTIMKKWGRQDVYDWDLIIDHEVQESSGFASRAVWAKYGKNNNKVFNWYVKPWADEGENNILACVAKDSTEGQSMMGGMDGGGTPGFCSPNYFPHPRGKYHGDTEEPYDAEKIVAAGGDPCFLTSLRCDQLSFNKACVAKAKSQSKAATGVWPAKLYKLIKNEAGKVVGGYVYVYEEKKYIKVNAGAVIIATGDYIGNKEFEKYFLPGIANNAYPSMGPAAADPDGVPAQYGDALKIGDWAGAAIQPHHAPMIHHMGNMGAAVTGMTMGMGIAPFLRLNRNGRRFMNEDMPGQQTENQLEQQPGQVCYQFWDDNWLELSRHFPPRHGSFWGGNIFEDWDTYKADADALSGKGTSATTAFAAGIESGAIFSDTTITGLLNKIKAFDPAFNVNQALASIKRYQKLCNDGEDEDFHKGKHILTSFGGKGDGSTLAQDNGPFYATQFTRANNLVNYGCLMSDEKTRVYDREGKVIEGLYVAGNAQGGKFAVQYPIALSGVASSTCMYYGYVAGKEAAGVNTDSGVAEGGIDEVDFTSLSIDTAYNDPKFLPPA